MYRKGLIQRKFLLFFLLTSFSYIPIYGQLTQLRPVSTGWPGDSFGAQVAIHGNQVAVLAQPVYVKAPAQTYFFSYENNTWDASNYFRGENSKAYQAIHFEPNGQFWLRNHFRVYFNSNTQGTLEDYSIFLSSNNTLTGSAMAISSTHLALNDAQATYYPYPNHKIRLYDKTDPTNYRIIKPDDYAPHQNYGANLAISEQYLAVSSPKAKTDGLTAGTVYIYNKENDWQLDTILAPADLKVLKYFGSSMLFVDDYLIIGSKGSPYRKGAVYLFKNTNGIWTQVQKVVSPYLSEKGDLFGISMINKGHQVFVGSPGCSKYGKLSGLVFEFKLEEDDLVFQQEIACTDTIPGMRFGWNIDIDEKLIVGAINNQHKKGKAYVFHVDQGNWIQEADFHAQFFLSRPGRELVMNDSILVATSIDDEYLVTYKKEGNSWIQDEAIADPTGTFNSHFGGNVALFGNELVTVSKSKCYVFQRNDQNKQWSKTGTLPIDLNFQHKKLIFKNNQIIISTYNELYYFKKQSNQWVHQYTINQSNFPNSESIKFWDFYVEEDHIFVQQPNAIVGTDSIKSGGVFLFKKTDNNLELEHTFFSEDGDKYDNFGFSFSKSGDYVAIGRPNHFPSGDVIIYHKENNEWAELTHISDSALGYGTNFGKSISFLDESTIAIGIPYTPNPTSKGRVQIFRRNENNEWKSIRNIVPDSPYYLSDNYIYFGKFMASSNNSLAIATPYLNNLDSLSLGSIYVFDYSSLPVKNTIISSPNWAIYPNPTDGLIELKGIPKNSNWLLINQLGQTIRQGSFRKNTLDFSDIQAGAYFLFVQTPQGHSLRKKLIITH